MGTIVKHDPITNRMICDRCWAGFHHFKNDEVKAPMECECLCVEAIKGAEQKRLKNLEKARAELAAIRAELKAAREDNG